MERSTAADLTGNHHPAAVFRQDADGRGISRREDRPHDAAREEPNSPLLVPPRRSLFAQTLADQRVWKLREQQFLIRPRLRKQAQQVAFLYQPSHSTGLIQPE